MAGKEPVKSLFLREQPGRDQPYRIYRTLEDAVRDEDRGLSPKVHEADLTLLGEIRRMLVPVEGSVAVEAKIVLEAPKSI